MHTLAFKGKRDILTFALAGRLNDYKNNRKRKYY